MRLIEKRRGCAIYWYDRQRFSVQARFVGPKLSCYTHNGTDVSLIGRELRECTRQEWKDDNGKFAPARVPRPKLVQGYTATDET